MTLNIWNYNRSWPRRRELIAKLIRDENPDVVGLQETRHDFRYERGKGQGDQLAELTGYWPTFAVGQVYVPVLRVDEGLTVLTRGRPAHITAERLTQSLRDRHDRDQRICLGVTIEQQGTRLHVFDTHFAMSATARETNALEVSRFVEREAGSEPAIVMGDLNAEPDAPPIRFLTGQQPLHGESEIFLDCWVAANGADPGYTYASFGPVRRIDYVLARNLPSRVSQARIVGGTARDGLYPSDHLGIIVEFAIS